jgi:hypothetical protein
LHIRVFLLYFNRMVTDKIKELASAIARVERLENELASELPKELAKLPGQYGFGDIGSFIRALKSSAATKSGRPAKAKKAVVRRKRAQITDATRAMVKKLVGAGKTGSQIAKALGISLPSVQNIKKALGLVKGRGKTAPKAKAPKAKKVKRHTKVARGKKPSAAKANVKAAKKAAAPMPAPGPESPQAPAV